MAFTEDTLSQLLLSLLAWAVVVVLYVVTKWRGGSVEPTADPEPTGVANRVLVLANETLTADELLEELRRIDGTGKAKYYVCVPANPVDTGQAERMGAVFLWEATAEAARRRLDQTLQTLHDDGLDAEGALGDYRPLRALAESVRAFEPDQIVISTLPAAMSAWLRYDVVDRARSDYPDIPVTHVESRMSSVA
jgi:GABA permease